MRFRLFHVLLMGDAVWASGGGGVEKKNSNMSLAMKKYAHTFSIQILQGQNRGDGHMSGAALWRCGGVAACACDSAHMFMGESHFSPFKWSSLFSSPSLHLCSYHSNTNGSSTAERSCVLSDSLNIHLTERRRGWQSASLAGRRLTGFLSVCLTDWLVIWGLGPSWLITCEGANKVTSWRAGASTGPAADWLVDSRED